MSLKRAAFWVAFWIISALGFGGWICHAMGAEKALEFFAGYIIEKSLSIDNLFIFLMIFTYFRVESKHQRRVLNYGIAGALILRLVMILIGVEIVKRFEWALYIFGAFLIYAAYHITFGKERKVDFEKNILLRIFKKFMPIDNEYHGERFFTRAHGKLRATTLFVVLLIIESTDIVFAVDSIPAIFAVTTDPFIVYTSNIFAILGLRSLYFFFERIQNIFVYVKQGVGVILFIAGVKLLLVMFHIKVPIVIALSVIAAVLIVSILASVIFPKKGGEMK